VLVEELTKSVLESGLLREEGDRYVLNGALSPFAIPTSLHDTPAQWRRTDARSIELGLGTSS
jgi:hypothetical protein